LCKGTHLPIKGDYPHHFLLYPTLSQNLHHTLYIFTMKSFILTGLTACAFSAVLAAPNPIQPRAACATAVKLSGNAFATRTLYANAYYASEVASAAKLITDSALAAKAAKVGAVGTFKWMYVPVNHSQNHPGF
jgi:hypothetical protein